MSNANQLQVVNRASDLPTVIQPQMASFTEVERMAHAVAKSQLFGMKTPEQAFALMMLAQAEGLHPMIAARDYDIIQGRPSKKAEAMLRDFQRSGGKVEWHELTDAKADATFSHPQGGTFRCDWDMARAKKAGLGGKDMWARYPRQMLRARCVSEGCKTVFPSSTSGMYTPEEAQDFEPAQPSRVETYQAKLTDVPPSEPAADAPVTRAAAPEPKPEPPAFSEDVIDGDGQVHTYDNLKDYMAGLRLAVSGAVDKGTIWSENGKVFADVLDRARENKRPKSVAALEALQAEVNEALAGGDA